MKRPDFDAIVVGAGAGGGAAAYHLTQAGQSVLVIEKAQLPRYKACGGAIPRPALDRFPFGFEDVIRAAPAEARFLFPGRPSVDVPLPDRPVVMVMRSDFDAYLLSQADAEVLQQTAVTGVAEDGDGVQVTAGGYRLRARYLVGADGATSRVAHILGLRRDPVLGGALEAEIPLDGSGSLRAECADRALFSLAKIPWGYAWVFPKGDRLSVGVARFRPGRVDLRSALKRELDFLGIRPDGARFHGHSLPCYRTPPWLLWRVRPQERLSTRRCVLVGDAAGLVDPFIGEGIRYAMTSARLAAEAIAAGDLAGYEAAIWREVGHDLATAGLVAGTSYRLPRLGYRLGVRNPAVVQHFVDLLSERHRYQGIGRRLLVVIARSLLNLRKDGET